MPICLASLPILPGSAAGAAALKYVIVYIYIYRKIKKSSIIAMYFKRDTLFCLLGMAV